MKMNLVSEMLYYSEGFIEYVFDFGEEQEFLILVNGIKMIIIIMIIIIMIISSSIFTAGLALFNSARFKQVKITSSRV